MAEERAERRLAAIMAADVVGYSRLMGADETGTLAALKQLQAELIGPAIAAYKGHIVKLMGDGALVEFASAVDAVECAVDIQGKMAERNAGRPEDRQIAFRIGINIGDIIIDGDDIFGDGVNIAARLEGQAATGGICISSDAYRQVMGKVACAFEDLGELALKNIASPVRAYQVLLNDARESATDGALPLPDKPSIAVLPFDNLSNDPEQEYFSDGLAEDLITDISNISGLFVTARNSSFAFKGQSMDVKELAAKLGVKHVLEGSVRKMGDKLRVNAQLIDAASGGHLWAQRYDGDLSEIFDFQENIRERIISALQVNLTPTDKALVERKPTESVEAYDLFLQGRAHHHLMTHEHTLQSIKCLEEAIAKDPNYADAYGYLSYCLFRGWVQMFPDFEEALERANKLAETGVALDGTSAIAISRLGFIQTWLHRYDQAIANVEKAFALAPQNAEVIATFSNVLIYYGEPNRALRMLKKAFSMETFVPPVWEFQVGIAHFLMGQIDQALVSLERLVERAPRFHQGFVYLASAYVESDRLDDARAAAHKVLQLLPQYNIREAARRLPHRNGQERNRILDCLRKAGLPEG